MQTAAVNNTSVSLKNSGQVTDNKTDTDEFTLMMAAMQLLPVPGSKAALQVQNETGQGKSLSNKTASTVVNDSEKDIERMLEGPVLSPGVQLSPTLQPGLVQAAMVTQNQEAVLNQAAAITGKSQPQQSTIEQNNMQIPLVKAGLNRIVENAVKLVDAPVPEQNGVVSPVKGETKQIVLEQPAGLKTIFSGNVLSQVQTENESDVGSGAMVNPSQAAVLKTQDAITGKSVPQLSAAVQNDGLVPLMQAGLKQVVENGVKRRDSLTPAQNDKAVSLAGEEIKQVVLDRQTGPQGLAGNVLQAAQKVDKSISETGAQETFNGAETVQVVGKESGGNTKSVKSLRTNSSDKTELLKTGSGTDFGQTLDNSLQPNGASNNTTLSAANSTESSESVALPDLKDRLVQEIKNILTTDRDKSQTQVQLKLEPEHLGRLTVKLYFNRDVLSAHFFTGNDHVKDILEGSLQQLRDSLSQNDLRLNEALVFSNSDGQGGGSMGRYFEERNERAWSAGNLYNNRTYADTQVSPANLPAIARDSSRVNYLI